MRRLSLTVSVLLVVATLGWAQGTTSRVSGTVSDATGGALPGATVTLTNQATDVAFTTTSTRAGSYVFEAVQVGTYTVTVEMPGFRRFVSRSNRVTIAQPATIDATLEVGQMAEVVEVTASAHAVQTATSGNLGATIEDQVIRDLPIVGTRGRNPLSLVLLQPGVVEGANTGSGTHVHGARDRAWNFTLDGIDTNESSAGGGEFSPLRTNPDMLAEMQVITGNFTAEFGRNSGGQVAMTTRSGTNDLRGTVFYFYRTPAFNANEWENNLNQTGKRQFVQHIPGFSLGGPIRKGKTFFFVNVQGLRAVETSTFTRLVYTEQARQGNWRYARGQRNLPSGVAGAVIDTSGNVLPGVAVGQYNIIANDPGGLGFDPTTRGLVGQTPLPNNFTVGDGLNVAGFTFVAPQREKQHDVVARIDHQISDHHSTFLRVAFGQQNTECDRSNGGAPPFPGLACLVNTERDPLNAALSWRWTPSGRVTNELVVGMNHFSFNFVNPSADPSRASFNTTALDIAGFPFQMPEDFSQGNARGINTYQLVDNLSYVRGAHQFKLGTNLRFQQHKDERGSVAGFNVHPIVNFSTATNTVDPGVFGIPTDINLTFDRPLLQNHINFLLGRVGSINQGFVSLGDRYGPGGTLFEFDARYPELDFYLQDNWKVRRNLTFDLGLRWEAKLSPRNPQGLIRRPQLPVDANQPGTNALRWETGPLYEDDWNNLAPSIGFAWDPKGNGKSVLRANYRLAFDRINTFVISSTIFQSIPGITLGIENTDFGQGGGRLRSLPLLAPPATNPEALAAPGPVSTTPITVMDREFDTPVTHGWSIGYQREILPKTVLDVTYVGRRASGLFGAYNANQVEIFDNGFLEAFNVTRAGGQSALMDQLLAPHSQRLPGETGSDMVRRLFRPALDLNSVAGLAGTLASRVQGGRTLTDLAGLGPYFFVPYPQFLGGMRVIDSNDWSRYHGLEISLQRRLSRGLAFLIGYTLSRSKDTRSFDPAFTVVSTGSAQSASSTPFDIRNRALNYAVSDFDRTHAVTGRWVWELPFGEGKRFASGAGGLAQQVLGGWEIAGQGRWYSGRPFTVYSGSNTLSNVVQTPANCDGCSGGEGALFDDPSTGIKFFFTPEERARFGTPGAGEFGNTGRNGFRGPSSFRMDLTVLKRFGMARGNQLELRADISNLTNTPTFGFPTATATSGTFGRIRDNVISSSRKMQMGVKYTF